MYIPEFWCGVGATVLVEIVILIIAAMRNKYKKKD